MPELGAPAIASLETGRRFELRPLVASDWEAVANIYWDGIRSGLATFETSLYSEWGDRRSDFALADLFGASADGDTIGPLGNSYMRIERRHATLTGFDGTALLPGPESRVPLRETAAGDAVSLTVVPYYPAFPPEMVFPRTPRTNQPAALFHDRGRSRVAYFAGDVERTFWRSGNPDLGLLLQNTVRWLRGDTRPLVSLDGDGIVETFAWETEPGYALHILNYTNPNMTRGFIRRFYAIGAQKAAFTVSRGRRIAAVRALRTARALPFSQDGDLVRFEVPSVTDYEVIALT